MSAEKFVWMNSLKERKDKSGNGLNSGNAAVVGKKLKPSRIHNGKDKEQSIEISQSNAFGQLSLK